VPEKPVASIDQFFQMLMQSEGDLPQRLQQHLNSQTFAGGKRARSAPPAWPQATTSGRCTSSSTSWCSRSAPAGG